MLGEATSRDLRLRLLRRLSTIGAGWWIPIIAGFVYLVFVVVNLGAIVNHTWWSADTDAIGFVAQLFHRPQFNGQYYYIIGDHGYYEALAFYLLTRGLPAHRAIWYGTPVFFWAVTIALVAISAGRAFGRYAAALVAVALVCVAPTGLMVIFQPTAHTNSIFHASVIALVTSWVLPRIRTLSLPLMLGIGVVLGAFSGLAAAGDSLSLVWCAFPFAVVIVLAAWRGPTRAVWGTIAFGLVTLIALMIVSALLGAVMHGLGFQIDKLAMTLTLKFGTVSRIFKNFTTLIYDSQYLIGGNYFGRPLTFISVVDLITAVLLVGAFVSVVFVLRKAAVVAGERVPGGDPNPVTPTLVHTTFWAALLAGGLFMFLVGSPSQGVSRYLVGPLVAVAALLPLAALRGRGWRILVAAGLTVTAITGVIRIVNYNHMPLLPGTDPIGRGTVNRLVKFADQEHVTYGYSAYWDAMNLSWWTGYRLHLYELRLCGPKDKDYCPRLQVTVTNAYRPRPNTRTLFIVDHGDGFRHADSHWGRPLAVRSIGRLTVYVYPYDIASRLRKLAPNAVQDIITGKRKPSHSRPFRAPSSTTPTGTSTTGRTTTSRSGSSSGAGRGHGAKAPAKRGSRSATRTTTTSSA